MPVNEAKLAKIQQQSKDARLGGKVRFQHRVIPNLIKPLLPSRVLKEERRRSFIRPPLTERNYRTH